MSAPREIHLTIGKGRYCIRTPLADDVLERMKDLIDQACGAPVKGMDQEDHLTLACLNLAYALDSATARLEGLAAQLGEQEAGEAAPE